jgi:hypothetical protein
MKIISNFKDYYDSARMYGEDPSLIYKRFSRIFSWTLSQIQKFEDVWKFYSSIPEGHSWHNQPEAVVLGFCGKLYPAWIECEFSTYFEEDSFSQHLMCAEDIFNAYEDRLSSSNAEQKKAAQHFFKMKVRTNWNGYMDFCKASIDVFLENIPVSCKHDIFQELQAPVFIMKSYYDSEKKMRMYRIITNPRLSDVSFYRFVDVFTAYQELSMYVGSILAQPDLAPQRVGSDEIIAKQKGFDEMSFRTSAPGNKKLNRKENRARKKE